MKRLSVVSVLLFAAALMFAGCGTGEKGATGDTGPAGANGTNGKDAPIAEEVAAESCAFCHAEDSGIKPVSTAHSIPTGQETYRTVTITGATLAAGANTSTVTFKVEESVYNTTTKAFVTSPVTDITNTDQTVRFTLVELVAGSSGDADNWAPYIVSARTTALTTRMGAQERNKGTGTSNSSSTTIATSNGTLDLTNAATGVYKYTFAVDVSLGAAVGPFTTATASNIATDGRDTAGFVNTRTHRIAIQHSGANASGVTVPRANAAYTFVPSTGSTDPTTFAANRDIVQTAICKGCHGENFLFHGNRKEVGLCVTCHNPTSTDPTTGNTVDFKIFIHKIHDGKNLPSVKAGGSYKVASADFSDVNLPQDVRNCQTCHTGTGVNVDNWKTRPTRQACTSCHDDLAPGATGDITAATTTHAGGQVTDNSCASCHTSTGTGDPLTTTGRKDVVVAHSLPDLQNTEGAKYAFQINSVTYTASAGTLAINYSVTYNSTKQELNKATTATAAAEWMDSGTPTDGANRLALSVGWGSKAQWGNDSSGSTPASPMSINALSIGGTGAVDNGDQTYTVTVTLPTDALAAGSGIVIMDGHPGKNLFGTSARERIPVKNAFKTFAITDTAAASRPAVVSVTKCNACHKNLSLHGNNRTGVTEVCVTCHNGNNTDISRRPAAAPTGTADSKMEESIDFKRMIHEIHGSSKRTNPLVVYGFGGTANTFDTGFPGVLNDCTTCHNAPTSTVLSYTLPVSSALLGSTVVSAPTATSKSTASTTELASHADDLKISPTASVCSSCHTLESDALHMQNVGGASFKVKQANIFQ